MESSAQWECPERPLVPPVEFLFEGLTDPRCILLSPNKAFCVCHHPPMVRWIEEKKPTNWCYLCAREKVKIDFVSLYHSPAEELYLGWGSKMHRLGLVSLERPMKSKIRSLILASLAPASLPWISLISHRDQVFGIGM